MSSPSAPIVLDLSLSMGPVFVSILVSAALWGAQLVQTVYYFLTYPKDNWWLKGWVITLLGLATAHTMLITKAIWSTFISFYGDFQQLSRGSPELIYQCIFTAIAGLMAQLYFLYRIYRFCAIARVTIFRSIFFKYGFPLLMLPLIVFQFIGYILYAVRLLGNQSPTELARVQTLGEAINGTVAAVDITLTMVTCIMLYLSRTGFSGTNRIVRNLIIVSLNSGAWSAIFAICTLAFLIGRKNDQIYAVWDISIMHTYCNTILGNLTSRNQVMDGPDQGNRFSTFKVIPLSKINARDGDGSTTEGGSTRGEKGHRLPLVMNVGHHMEGSTHSTIEV